MNEQLQSFARQEILEGLNELPESNQMLFKRMYSHKNLEADMEEVVANIPEEKLDRAMQQVQRTLEKQAA